MLVTFPMVVESTGKIVENIILHRINIYLGRRDIFGDGEMMRIRWTNRWPIVDRDRSLNISERRTKK